jgi:thiamine biosynthesis lipoprotein ApbE
LVREATFNIEHRTRTWRYETKNEKSRSKNQKSWTVKGEPKLHARLARTAAAGFTVLAGGGPVSRAMSGPAPTGPSEQQRLATGEYALARDGVLGTSLDLLIHASHPGDAARCQEAVLAEIDRLRGILSTYDPASEICRSQGSARVTSPELREVLAAYDTWSDRTGGTLDVRLGRVGALWREAGQTGRAPAPAELRAAWSAPDALNVDALGKSFIIDRAVAVARRLAPAGLLNLGGDLRAWGEVTWQVGVADPRHPAENAPWLAAFPLRDAAVATSGGYARFTTVAGERQSHLIDPRTLRPADWLASATVIAADCLTANALATASCLLDVAHSLALAAQHGSPGQLITRADSTTRGGLFAPVGDVTHAGTNPASPPPDATPPAPPPTVPWPKDYQITFDLMIGPPNAGGGQGGRGNNRPYIAIWVEDSDHQIVRTLSLLGTESNYRSDLIAWRRASVGTSPALIKAVTRATRPNGLYTVSWDGTDNRDRPVPQGTYSLCIEIDHERGHHITAKTEITCDGQPHTVVFAPTAESGASKIDYAAKMKG